MTPRRRHRQAADALARHRKGEGGAFPSSDVAESWRTAIDFVRKSPSRTRGGGRQGREVSAPRAMRVRVRPRRECRANQRWNSPACCWTVSSYGKARRTALSAVRMSSAGKNRSGESSRGVSDPPRLPPMMVRAHHAGVFHAPAAVSSCPDARVVVPTPCPAQSCPPSSSRAAPQNAHDRRSLFPQRRAPCR